VKLRVALVTESFLPSVNGVTNSVLKVLETLKSRGHEALVIAPTREGPRHLGFPVVTCPFISLGGFPVAIPTPAMTQVLDEFRPDVIHVAAPFWLGSQAIAYGNRRGIASVAVYQTDVSGYMERYGVPFASGLIDAVTASTHKQATLNLAPTRASQDYLEGHGVPRVGLWGRGVDAELFNPRNRSTPEAMALRARWAPGGEKIIGYVGRLAPEKQVKRLTEVCSIPGTQVVIVGDGPDRSDLERAFTGLNVTFAGRLTGTDLAEAYAVLDVFVHAGTEETFGQTIQEAHASGVPVVAPHRGGPRYLVTSGVTGYLVDPTRPGAFREKVELLVGDPEARLRMSERARAGVEGKTWERNNQELLAHYFEAIAMAGARHPLAA